MGLGNAVVVPGTSFASLVARAPDVTKGGRFTELVGGKMGLTAGAMSQILNAKADLEGIRLQTDSLERRNLDSALMQGFRGAGGNPLDTAGNRLAGQLLNLQLTQDSLTPDALIAAANDFHRGVNESRGLMAPWSDGPRSGVKRMFGSD